MQNDCIENWIRTVDITLERTFLEIVASGSFLRASEQLHVTQTAVSARVRTLESLLGCALFVRNKSGAALTAAGEQFVPHASALIQAWQHARQQVGVPPGRTAVIVVGCEASLWDPLMLDWLLWMRPYAKRLALRSEVALPSELLARVGNGTIGLAVLYAPQHRPGLQIDLLRDEQLVFVTTQRQGRKPGANAYVHVDWGPEFATRFALAYPELAATAVSVNLGPLGLAHVLAAGGAGYFRLAAVRAHLQAGRLQRVRGAPVFAYPVYAVYAEASNDPRGLALALRGLRTVAGVAAPTAPATKSQQRRAAA